MNMMEEMLSAKPERKLEDYFDMAVRQRWVLLIVAMTVFLVGELYSFSKTPVYQSAMTIQLQSEDMAMDQQQQMAQRFSPFSQEDRLQSKIAVIKSLPVAMRIVRELQLDRVTTLVSGRSLLMKFSDRLKRAVGKDVPLTHVYLKRFLYPVGQPDSSVLIEFMGEGKFLITNPVTGHNKKAGQSESVSLDGFQISIGDYYGPKGTTYRVANQQAEPIAKLIRSRLTAIKTGSDMLYVTYSDYDRYKAAAVLKSLASVYGDEEIAYKAGRLEKKENFLGEIGKRVQLDLNKLQAMGQSTNPLEAMQGELLLGQLEGAGKRWVDEFEEIKKTRFILKYLNEINDNKLPAAMVVLDVPEDMRASFSSLSEKISQMQDKRDLLTRTVTDKFPEVVRLDRQISLLKRQVKSLRRHVNSSLRQKISFLKQKMDQELEEIRQQQNSVNSELLRKAMLRKGQTAALNEMMEKVLEGKQQANIKRAILVSDVRVIEPAYVPVDPILPNRFNDTLMALLAALAMGLGAAFLRENMDRSIKSLSELESKTGMSVFGTLPYIRSADGDRNFLVTISRPRSPESEAYRSLRTNIQFANLESKTKTLILTSAVPGEGKTTTTCNLAVTLANASLKTLLVDCDLRKPRVNEYFGLERHSGLSDILIHSQAWCDIVMPTRVDNLDVLTSGSIPPNPSELLASRSMDEFLTSAGEAYDMILLDVPPVLVVTDAVLMAPKVDGLFLVVRANHAPVDAVQRALTQLNTVHIKPSGAIFNGFKLSSSGYGYKKYGRYGRYGSYTGYGGKYGYYSHDYGEEEKTVESKK